MTKGETMPLRSEPTTWKAEAERWQKEAKWWREEAWIYEQAVRVLFGTLIKRRKRTE